MPEESVLRFLARKPERDAQADADFAERFDKNIGAAFRAVDADIEKDGQNEYLLKGGRGSLKSSFISMEIVKLLYQDPKANALVLRKVAATMRDTVFAQILWALDTLKVYDEWECTVSPMKMVHKTTRQEIMFRGLDDPRKIKSIKPRRSCRVFGIGLPEGFEVPVAGFHMLQLYHHFVTLIVHVLTLEVNDL